MAFLFSFFFKYVLPVIISPFSKNTERATIAWSDCTVQVYTVIKCKRGGLARICAYLGPDELLGYTYEVSIQRLNQYDVHDPSVCIRYPEIFELHELWGGRQFVRYTEAEFVGAICINGGYIAQDGSCTRKKKIQSILIWWGVFKSRFKNACAIRVLHHKIMSCFKRH